MLRIFLKLLKKKKIIKKFNVLVGTLISMILVMIYYKTVL